MKKMLKINILILFFVVIANVSYANENIITEEMLKEYADSLGPTTSNIQEQTEFTVFTKNSNETYSVTREEILEKNIEKYGEENATRNITGGYNPNNITGMESNLMLSARSTPPTYLFNKMNTDTRLCRIVVNDLHTATGFLVGPKLLITAAHVVYGEGNSVNKIVMYPGYNNGRYQGDAPNSSGWQQIYAYPIWLENNLNGINNRAYDMVVIELDWNMGNEYGYYYCQSYGTSQEMNNLYIKEYGYPELLELGHAPYCTAGNITTETYDTYLYSDAVNYEGMSGGPILRNSDDFAVGCVSSLETRGFFSQTFYTYGRRITQDIIDLINSIN